MKYIFEDIVKFDVKNHCLTHIQTNDNISLAASGGVLLEYLIKNQGCVVTRNRLLDDIFKKNDRADSDSNLSHSISMLRKGFRDLGVNTDILVTKPRVGLLLPEEVKIEPVNNECSGLLTNKHVYKTSIKALSVIPLFILLWFFSGLMGKSFLSLSGKETTDEAVNINGCKVYILQKKEDVKKRISTLINRESLPCDEQDNFYYLDNDVVDDLVESLIHCRTSTSYGEVCGSYLSRNSL